MPIVHYKRYNHYDGREEISHESLDNFLLGTFNEGRNPGALEELELKVKGQLLVVCRLVGCLLRKGLLTLTDAKEVICGYYYDGEKILAIDESWDYKPSPDKGEQQ